MNVFPSCKQNQKNAVMALLQVGKGKRGFQEECLCRVTLPDLSEGHVPVSCGCRIGLPCMETPGSTKEVKRETLYVSTGGKERAHNVGRPPKDTLFININYVPTPVLFVGLQ